MQQDIGILVWLTMLSVAVIYLIAVVATGENDRQ